MNNSYQVAMEIAGDSALWTRPDCGDSPCSYPAPTYSAVRGIFESIAWGPAIIVVPRRVELCSKPVFHSYVTNYGGPLRKDDLVNKGNNYQLFATILINVCYRLYADVIPNPNKESLPDTAKRWDHRTTAPGHAYKEIFNRRLRRGQSFGTLCLGWSEFTPSYFGPFRTETCVCADLPDIEIPSMLRGMFQQGYNSQYKAIFDTNVHIHAGVLEYPKRDDCL